MNLSIIIVNWKSVGYLDKCLAAIYRETSDPEFEVIVVDNASFDGCEELLRNHYAGTKFIQSRENIGFAKANNLGFEHSSGDILLFLNPDTEVLDSAINILCLNLQNLPGAGAVGGKLLNSDGSIQMSCIQPFPTIYNQILDIGCIQRRFPWHKAWGIRPLFMDRGIPEEVDAISGACVMIKRSVFERVGRFSTDYFMYSEDVDLCYKIRKAGWKIFYVGKAEVVHHGGGSSREHTVGSFENILMRESIYRFLGKTRGRTYAGLYKISQMSISGARLLLIFTAAALVRMGYGERKMSWAREKWLRILRWSLGMEGWARKLDKKGVPTYHKR